MSDTIDRYSANNHGFTNPLPRLILISGWAHDSSAMEYLRKCLKNTADVSAVSTGDLWSAKTQIRAPSSYAQNLAKLIEKSGSQVFIAGWSLGGIIALETAAYRPDLVAGLILISSTAKFITGENWTSGVPPGALRAMTAMLKHNPRGVFRTFFKNVALPLEENEEAMTLRIEKACAINPLELSAGLEYLSKADLRNEAAKLNIPALILHGQHDAIIPVEAGLALKSLLPNSEIRVYENCGHGLPWQNPNAITEDIKGVLEECQNRNIHAIGRLAAAKRGPPVAEKQTRL